MVGKKMTRQARAKQFMPFAALKGYEEALRQVELAMEQERERQKLEAQMEYREEIPFADSDI